MIVATTPRLLLRRWEIADAGAIVGIYGDAETMRYFGNGSTFTPDDFGFGNYAVVEAATDRVIGHAGVRHHRPRQRFEADWLIDRALRRRGYGTEAARAVLERAFVVDGASEIWGVARRDNAASIALMERVGMTFRNQLTKSS